MTSLPGKLFTKHFARHGKCAECLASSELVCGECGVAAYCSETCRKSGWEKTHQSECSMIQSQLKNTFSPKPIGQDYWGNKGRYQTEYNQVVKLIPMYEDSKDPALNLLGRFGRVYYGYYNNGDEPWYGEDGSQESYLKSYNEFVALYRKVIGSAPPNFRAARDIDSALDSTVDTIMEWLMENRPEYFEKQPRRSGRLAKKKGMLGDW